VPNRFYKRSDKGKLTKEDGLSMKKIHANIPESTSMAQNTCRDRIDLLQSRVGLLTGKDKVLMTMYLKNGNSFRQMARLTGVNEVRIARRIHKVTKRLLDGEYITCLRNRDKFTGAELDIAKDYFLLGLSMKKIAKKHNSTYYRVRETLKKIQRLIKIADGV
jgi:predicted DNA-binding protein YlxM (UPF0122 family)